MSFKCNFNEDDHLFFDLSKVRRSAKATDVRAVVLRPLYTWEKPISDAKLADLLSLCTEGIIPKAQQQFYRTLNSRDDIRDALPEPDGDESDECEEWIRLPIIISTYSHFLLIY